MIIASEVKNCNKMTKRMQNYDKTKNAADQIDLRQDDVVLQTNTSCTSGM